MCQDLFWVGTVEKKKVQVIEDNREEDKETKVSM